MDLATIELLQIGFSHTVIKSMGENITSVFDLIINHKFENLLKVTNRKAKLNEGRDILKDEFENIFPKFLNKPSVLVNFGSPKKQLLDIISFYDIKNINELHQVDVDESIDKIRGVSKNGIKKIEFSLRDYNNWIQSNKNSINKNLILLFFYKNKKCEKQYVSERIEIFIKECFSENSIPNINIQEDVQYLIENDYLESGEDTYYFPTNMNYTSEFTKNEDGAEDQDKQLLNLEEILAGDYKDIDILKLRLEGKTLDDVGSMFGVTRERIRQRQKKLLTKLGEIYEIEKYRAIFESYEFSKGEFVLIFNESPQIFELLNLILKKGNKDAAYYVRDMLGVPSKVKIDYLVRHGLYLDRFGEIKRVSKKEFFEDILFQYKNKSFTSKEFFSIYNSEADERASLDLQVENHRSIDGLVQRSDYTINTFGQLFRYFDYNLTEEEIMQLKEIVNSLDSGCYSMIKLFNENLDFMKKIDVRDEYELHNLYKRQSHLLSKNVHLNRSPEFKVGGADKKEFFFQILMEFSNEPVESCVDYIYDEYGMRKNTMESYISANYRSYINDGRIISNSSTYSEEVIEDLRNILKNDIYLKKDVVKIIEGNGEKLNTILLSKLGYYMRGNIIYKKEFGSVSKAFSSVVFKEEFYKRNSDDLSRSGEMYSFLYKMELERKLLALEKDLYISVSFLRSRGLTLEVIEDFVNQVYNSLPTAIYFSLFSLQEKNFYHELLDYGFEQYFYERLIVSSDKFRVINVSSPRLFVKGLTVPATYDQFFSDKLATYENGIDIYDFADDLKDEFNINFSIENIKTSLLRYGAYYSSELKKIYFDKENYLDEVYGK